MIYSSLRRDIELWTNNSDPDFLYSINSFIRQAEDRIGGLVTLPAYVKSVNVIATQGSFVTVVDLDSFMIPDHIYFPLLGIVEKKSTSFLLEAYPDPTELGPIRYFAMRDDKTIVWGPCPNATVTGIMECSSKWPSLVDLGSNTSTANQETFISSKFPTALFYGALYYSRLWMQDSDGSLMAKQEMMDGLGLVEKFADSQKRQKAEKGNAAIEGGSNK